MPPYPACTCDGYPGPLADRTTSSRPRLRDTRFFSSPRCTLVSLSFLRASPRLMNRAGFTRGAHPDAAGFSRSFGESEPKRAEFLRGYYANECNKAV